MSEKNGIVTLEELFKKEIFIELDNYDEQFIREKIKNIKGFYKFLTNNNAKDWFYKKTRKLRLDVFKEILKSLNISNIKIKTILGKQGLPIENPEFPLSFITKEGVRFVSCILGDGCIHEKGIRYYNKNEVLIENFICLTKTIFGNISYKKYINKDGVIAISLPKISKKIVEVIGLTAGRKSTRNIRIPKFIFNLSKEKKLEFISQFIDDEGCINNGRIIIDLGFDDSNYPLLIYDLQELLSTLDISSTIFPVSGYYSKSGRKRRMWRLGIFTFNDAKKLVQELNILNSNKCKRCEELLTLQIKEKYKGLDKYVQTMKEIENRKGYFSTLDLAIFTKKSIRHIRRILNTTKRLGMIKLVEPPCKGYKNISYAVYQMVK